MPPRNAPVDPAVAANAAQARQLIALFLQKGVKQPHTGEQITRLLQGTVHETRQSIKYMGPGRNRMEYLSPPDIRGEIILIANGRFFHYIPGPPARILDGFATPEEFQARIRELFKGMNNRTIRVQLVGDETIAGRRAGIVEIRAAGSFFLKFWIDDETGVRLKYQKLDNMGRAVSETFFTSINYELVPPQDDFRPILLPNVPHEPLMPDSQPLGSIQAAQQLVPYIIKEPAIPNGYHTSGIWVIAGPGGHPATILRYTDGVNTYGIFMNQASPLAADAPEMRIIRQHNGVAHWVVRGIAYTLIGNLRPLNVRLITDSLR
jgi:hypothetical protein